jgi:hypothetical protein
MVREQKKQQVTREKKTKTRERLEERKGRRITKDCPSILYNNIDGDPDSGYFSNNF